jgi:hypothetical protein
MTTPEAPMETFNPSELQELLKQAGGTCVSIYLPTQPIPTRDTRGETLHFKNLLADAQEQLTSQIGDPEKARAILRPAFALLADEEFWKHQGQGLAVLLAADVLRTFRLPGPVEEAVYVDNRFYVTPLLELLNDYPFYILTLNRGSARLLSAGRGGARDLAVPGMPKSQAEANQHRESEKLLQMRNSAGPAGSFHGEGADTHEPNVDEREFLLKIDDALASKLRNGLAPLVVIGLAPLPGMFAGLTKHQNLVGRIEHDAAHATPAELQRLAWPFIEPLTTAQIRSAQNVFGSFSANQPNRTANDPAAIIEAAEAGRVDTLLVARPNVQPEVGAFGERIPSEHGTDLPTPEPQLESAVQATLANSGRVCLVPQHDMPTDSSMAAILRY